MSTQLSLTSMTLLGNAQVLFSTLSNDSWASFINFNFDFLLVTSCHCSFSLSSNKHHACSSSSSSCTSSLLSPLSSSTAFRLLFQLPLVQLAAMCSVFPQLQQTLVSPLPPFSCPFSSFLASGLGPLSLPSAIHSSFTLAAVEVFCVHSSWDPVLHSIHLWPLFLCTLLALKVHMFLRTLLRTLPRRRFLQPCRSPSARSCQFFFTVETECVVTLSMMMFSSAMSHSSNDNVCHGIDSSANS